MSLPVEAVDRIFRTLAATYGMEWERLYANTPLTDVKTVWLDVLDAFDGQRMVYIAWALKNLPERCPNAIQFRSLCRQAPAIEEKLLSAPSADPARVKAEMEKLAPVRQAANAERVDHKAWAKSIVARHEAGDRVRPISLRFAHEALGMKRGEA